MQWPWNKRPLPETDVDEARQLEGDARDQHRRAVLQGWDVTVVTSYLAARRELNHFGDSITISFTRRGRG